MGVLRDERDIFSYDNSENDLEELDNEIRKEREIAKKHQQKLWNKNRVMFGDPLDNDQSSRKCGVKKSRRGENMKYLLNLVEKEDDLELSMEVGEPSMSVFAELFMEHEKMKVWNDFINCSEDEQSQILQKEREQRTKHDDRKEKTKNGNIAENLDDSWEEIPDIRAVHPAYTAEECYQRLDRNIKLFLKRRNIPVGMLSCFERDLIHFFREWPGSVYVSKLTSSFERMLLHATCQYLNLSSNSFDDGNCRQTHVENRNPLFSPPSVLLSSYLQKAALS